MVGHDHEFVEQIGGTTIVIKSLDQQFRPGLSREQISSTPSRRSDHVGLAIVRRMLSQWPHRLTSAAKAANRSLSLTARLEGAPFQSSLSMPLAFSIHCNRYPPLGISLIVKLNALLSAHAHGILWALIDDGNSRALSIPVRAQPVATRLLSLKFEMSTPARPCRLHCIQAIATCLIVAPLI